MNKTTTLASIIGWALIALGAVSCSNKEEAENPEVLHRGMRRIIEILRHDNFSPPVSSRIFAYTTVAAYEALIPGYPEQRSLAGQLNGLTEGPKPEAGKEYCYPLASTAALMKVGKQLIFSEASMDDLKEDIFQEFEAMGIPQDVYDRSIAYGEAVAAHILAWAKTDNYAQIRSLPKYTITVKDPSRWIPTPPQNADALEPYWTRVRPWVMDSARQFPPIPPVPFSEDTASAFYKAAFEVYQIGKTIGDADRETALYWDDNPFEVVSSGRLTVTTKKISPPGHWINIAGQVCRKANAPITKTAETYVLVSVVFADAFISCWTEKFTSNLVRPETYINRHIDENWRPLIETPPFPEHTSGHATTSAAAATILTKLYGDAFEFTDSTEVEFGLKPRTFKSFYEASDQAALSRLLGGIHYRNGNEGGRLNGRTIGEYVWEKVRTH
ncbi:MAG: vanadium-dependent haloperoxidase [Saprospiraceae bacterium]